MSLSELFSKEAERAFGYIRDVGLFLTAPRHFLSKTAFEGVDESTRRLIVYTVAFSTIEVTALAGIAGRSDVLTISTVLTVSLLETVFALVFVPAFFVTARLTGIDRPLKTSVIYAVVFRCTFLLLPSFAYSAFVASENYSFAILKGVWVYAFFGLSMMVFPIVVGRGWRQKAKALATCCGASLAISITIAAVLNAGAAERNLSYSLLFDPIASEVDEADLSFSIGLGDTELNNVMAGVQQLTGFRDSGPDAVYLLYRPSDELLDKWNAVDHRLTVDLPRIRTGVEANLASARFRTTRKLLRLKLDELDAASTAQQQLKRLFDNPSFDQHLEVLHAFTRLLEAESAGYAALNGYWETAVPVHRWGLAEF